MSIIYEPKGPALEYSPLAANLWLTCTHRCKYCYPPAVLHKTKEVFFKEAPARKNVIKELAKDCQKIKCDKRPVLLCFLCDPYQPHDVKRAVTREALEILALYHMTAQVLTKGGTRAARDFDILKKRGWKFGTTLSISKPETKAEWEPGAASVMDRLEAISIAHDMDIFTWVSVEPVIDPEQALEVIDVLEKMRIVDFWKVGKLNHDKERELKIDWAKFIKDVRLLLKGRPHYIKTDLLAWEK
jgi:DNA repair photolyase